MFNKINKCLKGSVDVIKLILEEMDAKVMLKWNQSQMSCASSFKHLRSEEDFFDVTLVSSDQVQMQAHKVVLSASSKFFKKILRQNKHYHPIVCLDGVSSGHLEYLLDYIYDGEVNIFQDDLDAFLLQANKFKLECELGKVLEIDPASTDPYDLNTEVMMEEEKVDIASCEINHEINTDQGIDNRDQESKGNDHPEELSNTEVMAQLDAEVENDIISPEQTKSNFNFETDKNIEHVVRGTPGRKPKDASFIDDNTMVKIKSQFEKIMKIKENGGKRYFQCSKCKKTLPHTLRRHALSHVETHIEGLVFSCKFCKKEFRLSDSLRMHVSRNHNKKL